MDQQHDTRVLVINSGSSSLKCALYRMAAEPERLLTARLERIGLRGSLFHVQDENGLCLVEGHSDLTDHEHALKTFLDWLAARFPQQQLAAVGHRVVHGGPNYSQPGLIDQEMLAALRDIMRLAPEHLPHALKAIQAVGRLYPDLKQVACFDTAFHRHMPAVAQRYPLPRTLWHEGVVRYGFHGLSYEYILGKLGEVAGAETARGRVIIAHLGNGCSMAAVRDGQSIDTTMGFTPAGGLMMGMRSGDLDPGVLFYLLEEKNRSPATVDYIVNQRSGLIGVSESSSDMRDLLAREAGDPHAAEAVELFCYQARKFLGAMAAVLGGLDTLVFTAGIGAHAWPIRQRICQDLDFLGIQLDDGRNQAHAPVISRDNSPATVRVMETDEELMIARHVKQVLSNLKS